jgi:hypothetical protein
LTTIDGARLIGPLRGCTAPLDTVLNPLQVCGVRRGGTVPMVVHKELDYPKKGVNCLLRVVVDDTTKRGCSEAALEVKKVNDQK